ncbi:MAG: geranylgeranylglyceryl/heptaprenylglyceryl phosphate synthase [Paludibacter sp.]
MKTEIYASILQNIANGKKMLAVLIDPDKCNSEHLHKLLPLLKIHTPDFIFVGGSQLKISFSDLIETFKHELHIPVVLFPGDVTQFSPNADALLFISLISGRNAEYLISQHVNAAIPIKKSGLEVIPTGYILIDGGKKSAVEYISNTQPIPRDKNDIALATALAGELLGMKAIYLEAGSGANLPVLHDMIQHVKAQISVPIIVGGGIKNNAQLQAAYRAGADLVVIGNILETEPAKIEEFVSKRAT